MEEDDFVPRRLKGGISDDRELNGLLLLFVFVLDGGVASKLNILLLPSTLDSVALPASGLKLVASKTLDKSGVEVAEFGLEVGTFGTEVWLECCVPDKISGCDIDLLV